MARGGLHSEMTVAALSEVPDGPVWLEDVHSGAGSTRAMVWVVGSGLPELCLSEGTVCERLG